MSKIPIFDSLTHPSINANWLSTGQNGKNSISSLLKEMDATNIGWAFAVGMSGIGGYDVNEYYEFITNASPNLYPVAYCDFGKLESSHDIKPYLKKIKEKKYTGIKIHPRYSRIMITDKYIEGVIKTSNEIGLTPFLCTFLFDKEYGLQDPVGNLFNLFKKIPEEKVILLHGGVFNLIKMMHLAKYFRHILLDLSYTMCKYEGSSIDLDIKYLFENFDRRICVGSDHPEFSLKQFRRRFDYFAANINIEQVKNIAYKNIIKFTGLQIKI